ncbi:hypothetical protein C1646_669974 [Rhizophagus diaphanus]|nr:hypothetical protein C1646_669974 [Rhizophagus diaphanus] [Rhizophagus sp. MUCL 43196]
MNSLVVLYKILRKFHRELKRIEKIFLYTYIIDMVTYSFLFIGTLILSGQIEINYILFPILLFPIISGLIMFYGKTVYHGLAFLGVHSFPIFAGIAYFYTQYFHCRDKTVACNANDQIYYAGVAFLVALVFLFQLLHTLYVYLIWKKSIWPLVHEFKYSRHDEIKGMHAVYEVQFPLFHAQTMMIGLWFEQDLPVIQEADILTADVNTPVDIPLDITSIFSPPSNDTCCVSLPKKFSFQISFQKFHVTKTQKAGLNKIYEFRRSRSFFFEDTTVTTTLPRKSEDTVERKNHMTKLNQQAKDWNMNVPLYGLCIDFYNELTDLQDI